jgi:hypothetical protein
MKRLLFALMLICTPTLILAQEEPAEPADQPVMTVPIKDLDTNNDGRIDAEEAKALIEKDASGADVAKGVGEVVDAARNIKGKSGNQLALAISVLLAAIFKMLLSLIKVVSKNTDWFKSSRGKSALKYSTLALGALAAIGAGIATAMGANLGWMDVLIIGLSGPGSMVVHELSSLLPGVGKHASKEG